LDRLITEGSHEVSQKDSAEDSVENEMLPEAQSPASPASNQNMYGFCLASEWPHKCLGGRLSA